MRNRLYAGLMMVIAVIMTSCASQTQLTNNHSASRRTEQSVPELRKDLPASAQMAALPLPQNKRNVNVAKSPTIKRAVAVKINGKFVRRPVVIATKPVEQPYPNEAPTYVTTPGAYTSFHPFDQEKEAREFCHPTMQRTTSSWTFYSEHPREGITPFNSAYVPGLFEAKRRILEFQGSKPSFAKVRGLMRTANKFLKRPSGSFLPTPPAETERRRNGNCFDKSVWLANAMNDPNVEVVFGNCLRRRDPLEATRDKLFSHAWLRWRHAGKYWLLAPFVRTAPIDESDERFKLYTAYYLANKTEVAMLDPAQHIYRPVVEDENDTAPHEPRPKVGTLVARNLR